jgi:Uma2 family endonuclease
MQKERKKREGIDVTTTLIPTQQQTQHLVLQGISWQTYQALLSDLGNHRSSRLVYDQGILEIIMPSGLHEIINRLLALIITALTDELGMKIRNCGSTTLEREDLAQGVEPDSCFYIQNVDRILGRPFDIHTNPPPDLVIEVDITSSSRRRFHIYLQLQIPEVWRYTQQGVMIYQLQNGMYVECEFSPTFKGVSTVVIMEFLKRAELEDDNGIIQAVRQWIRSNRSDGYSQ